MSIVIFLQSLAFLSTFDLFKVGTRTKLHKTLHFILTPTSNYCWLSMQWACVLSCTCLNISRILKFSIRKE